MYLSILFRTIRLLGPDSIYYGTVYSPDTAGFAEPESEELAAVLAAGT